MSYFLNIETATTVCSVSISENQRVLFCKELNAGYTHAENLHLFIEQGLKETGLKAAQLNAIAVSKGPGSYTGLRIGVSAAKGLAYALNLPLISIDTLQLLSFSASLSYHNPSTVYCPMIDARRMEVYTALYDHDLQAITSIEALIVDDMSIEKFRTYADICFFGDGMEKCKALLSMLPHAHFLENKVPSAQFMPSLVDKKFKIHDFEDPAYFEPFYLKDFLAGKKKQKTGI